MHDITRGSRKRRSRAILFGTLRLVGLLCLGLLLGLLGLQSPFGSMQSAYAQSVPVAVGYRDFGYGITPSAEITADKAESKLWWNDGFWWGVLWVDSIERYRIHKLDVANQSWINTGVAIDTRAESKADVLWDGQKLYIVSHIHTSPGPTTSANAARLYRFSYDSGSKSYSLDAGFPVQVNSSRSESLVLEKDSSGQLWITWTEIGKIMVNRTIGDDLTWGTPFILPVQGNDVTLDDISSIIAFGSEALAGSNKIGLMWSNQNDKITYFAAHRDSDADEVWQPREQALADPSGGTISDDHINLKSCAGSDEVFAVTKTNLSGTNAAWIVVVKRDAAGIWTSHVVATRGDGHTQPIMVIDRGNQKLYVFARSNNTGTGIMYVKSADLSILQFPPGLGTPFIQSDTDLSINNPTSTKQCVDGNTGLLVLASDQNTRFYLHNYIDLSGGKPVITNFTPTIGAAGTQVTITGSNFTGATGVAFNGTAATSFTVDSGTQIRATVPAGATTGKISVTNSSGTGLSAANFTVAQVPVITSFTPTSGPAGTQVTITGSNFTGATGVAFNGVAATSFTVVSGTQVRATVPAGATTGKISVTNSSGTGLSAANFTVAQVPAITSFTPTSGPAGTQVTITGSNFTGATGVAFNGVAATSFTVDSGTQIRATVPAGATTGKISVTNFSGTGLSAANFTVAQVPVVTSFTPASGAAGTQVTITGNNFTGATAVAFNATAATSFTIDSNTQIRATVPAGATTGKISVTNSSGTGLSAANFTITQVPAITSFTPVKGSAGAEVTIVGSNFTGVTNVAFNGIATASFTVDSGTQIRANVPAGVTTGKISVTNSFGTGFSAVDFVVSQPPIVTSFTPSSGQRGTEVTINGNKLAGVTNVAFNGVSTASFTVLGDTQIRANVPAGATTGKISVSSSDGTGFSATDFVVIPSAPTTTFKANADAFVRSSSLTTNFGTSTELRLQSGTTLYTFYLKFNVTGLVGSAQSAKLRLYVTNPGDDGGSVFAVSNNYQGTSTPWDEAGLSWGNAPTLSGTPLQLVGPVLQDTWVEIDVTPVIAGNGAYSFGLSNNSNDRVIYSSKEGLFPPELVVETTPISIITSFAPGNGPVGTEVTITGFHFNNASGVAFNSIPTSNFTIDSDTQIRAKVPAGATTGKIGITSSAGTALSANDFTVTSVPVLTSFTPANGPANTEVTITGTGFFSVTGVTFNGVNAANFTVASATQIRARVPAGATTGKIGVTNSAGTGLSANDFIVTALPAITSFTPTNGPVNAEVTLTGANFAAATDVTFNGIAAASFTVDSNTQLRATVPAGTTTGKIAVTNSAGTGSSANDFIVTTVPAITSFTPGTGVSGTEVTINGTNFSAITAVTFNGIAAASFTVDSNTKIRANVPAGATTGRIGITNSAGTGLSANDFAIMAITSFAPGNGPAGTEVTITGADFSGITSVTFNGIPTNNFTIDSNTQIRAEVPIGATSGKVGITNSLGTALSVNDFIVTALPVIASFTPRDGVVGTEVTIAGDNFTAIASVTFNGAAASSFTVDSDTQIRANVPEGATIGKIGITNSAGTGSSADDFIVTAVPVITSFTPANGPVGTQVTITGNNFTGTSGVTFNGIAATSFTLDSDTQLRAHVPPGVTIGKIAVTNSAGTGLSVDDFIVTQSPAITSFTPTIGPQGTEVTIVGSNFVGTATVAFNSTPAISFTVDSNTQIRANVPLGATTGKISVINSAGTGVSGGVFTVKPPPVVSFFTPLDGPVGTIVTITGSHFTGATTVAFNGTAANFTLVSNTQLRATVPAGAPPGRGKISVTTADGTGSSANDFIVTLVPAITSFLPGNGPVSAEVTLAGAHFAAASSVTFNGIATTGFTVDSDTQLRAQVPPGATTGRIAVINSAGIGFSAVDFIVTSGPAITSFTPADGPAGTEVTLSGINFTAATSVTFNGIESASFTVDSDTRLRVHVPPGATTGKIGVINSAGTGLSANNFIVTSMPVITSFTPANGPVGTEVTLTGSHFAASIRVTFNGITTDNFTVDSDIQLRATVPPGATTGKIAVTNSAGTGSSTDNFIVTFVPVVTSFTPRDGPVGTEVTLTGSRFAATTTVTFNGAMATSFTVDSGTKLRATVPPGATTGKIAVTNSAGTGSSTADFIVTKVPAITSFTPGDGPVGTQVTLNGFNFTAATNVTFNGIPAGNFTVDSDTQLRAQVPLAPTGATTTGKIGVTNSSGTGLSTNDFTVTKVPSITAFVPGSGPVGAEVTLTGAHFTAATRVTFDETPALNFTVDSDTQIRATVPPGATTGKISVTNSAGTGASANDFTVIAITSFTPSDGPVGAEVTLTGAHFTGITSVIFNNTLTVEFVVDSDTQIRAIVPAGATTGKLFVVNAMGSGSSADDFIVTKVPVITSFTPAAGPAGKRVTITGINFTAITGVTFNGTPANQTVAASFTVNSSTQIRATVPVGATTGKIGVINSAGAGFGTNDFNVLAITSFTPSDGPAGTEVTLTGSLFTGATAVTFNGTPAASFTVDSDTQIRVIVPAGATTGQIGVTTSVGTALSVDAFILTQSPSITLFSPTIGPEGTEVTIIGSNFAGATAVVFNGTPATSFTIDSDTQLRANVPVGATTGKISVSNSSGIGFSGGAFTVKPPPKIASFTPRDGGVGRQVTIAGSNFVGAVKVAFNGTLVTNLIVDSSTQIRTNVPTGATTGKISVTTADGVGLSAEDFIVTFVPVITSFAPGNGPIGTEITITGARFAAITSVTFNGVGAGNFTVDSETQLRATVPPGATTGKIRVSNSAGSGTSAADFIVTDAPVITSFTPGSGLIGSEVTIIGTNFTAATGVSFSGGAAATSLTVDSDTQIRAHVPLGAATGKIAVTNSAGTGFSTTDFTPIYRFNPSEDSYVNSSNPTDNFGASTTLRLRSGSPILNSYIKFNVTGLGGLVRSAKLRLRVTNDSPDGGSIYKVSNNYKGTSNPWDEEGLIRNNAPAISGTPLGTLGAVSFDTWVELDVTAAITINGVYSFGLSSNSTISVLYSSKEGTHQPELIIVTNPFSAPVVSAFAPGTGPVGTEVTITGNNFIGTTNVTFNGIAATNFTVDSNTQLRANVPAGVLPGRGKIGVTNSAGTGLSADDFIVTAMPAITSFTPVDGPVGTAVTITGNSFIGTTSVTFDGIAATNFTVDSNTQIRAEVPVDVSPGRHKIGVINSAGDALSADDFIVTAVPAITSFTPADGPIGAEVTITGNNFIGTTSVTFNDIAATSFTVDSNTQLRASVPVAPTGATTTGKIGAANSAGTGLSATDFIVTQPPAIISFSPVAGPVGVEVTVTGSQFTGTTAVAFNGTPALNFTVDSETQLRATVPVDAATGKISVANSAGTGLSAADFTVTSSLLAFIPIEDAEVKSSSPETNYGSNAILRLRDGSVQYRSYLKFSVTGLTGSAAPVRVQRAALRLFVLAGSEDGGLVYLVSNNYTDGVAPWEEDGLTWDNAPALVGTSLSSAGGPLTAGTFVELEVTSAIAGNGIYSFGLLSSSTNVATYSSKEGVTAPQLVIETTSTPGITSFTPAAGPVGTEVTISGINFTGATSVAFNGTPATSFTVDSDTQIRAKVPAGVTTGKITVTNADGSDTSATDFMVLQPPVITSFTPRDGGVGDEVTIAGSNFSNVTNVAFNGTPLGGASFTVDSDTQLRAKVPVGATTGKISVTNAAGTGFSANDFTVTSKLFTYNAVHDAEVKSSSPESNYGSNAILRVRDGSVRYRSYLKFNVTGLGGPATPVGVERAVLRLFVSAGSDDGGSVYLVSNNYEGSNTPWNETGLVWNNAPAISSTPLSRAGGPIVADTFVELEVTAAITGNGIYSFGLLSSSTNVVSYSSKEGTNAPQLVIETSLSAAPGLTSFTPVSGPVGTEVTITGVNFTGVTGAAFNGTAATSFTVDSDTQIRAKVPAGATTGKISVTNADGSGTSATDFAVVQPPVITSFTPASGVAGTEVTITGNNFTGATSVTFNSALGGTAANFIVDANTQLRAIVPAGATTGKIGVGNSAGTGLSATDFIVTPPPAITTFAPTSGPVGIEVTITGINFTGATGVAFNGIPTGNFTIDSDTQIRAKVPVGATTGKVGITSAAGTGTSPADFTVASNRFTFNPVEDAEVKSSSPTTNFGSNASLRLRGGSVQYKSYLKFNVIGLGGPAAPVVVRRATLRLFVIDGSNDGGAVYLVSNRYAGSSTPWDEDGLIWNNVPILVGTPLSNANGPIVAGTFVEFEVTAAIAGNGIYSFGLSSSSTTAATYSSKEGLNAPELVIETGSTLSAPAITSFAPVTGPVGTEVTISGINFTGATGVAFNGTPASAFVVDSDIRIRANVPVGASTGKISVTTAAGAGLSADDFTVRSNLFVFNPIEDAEVKSSSPETNFGLNAILRARDGSVQYRSYLKFDVTGLGEPAKRATLRLFAEGDAANGGSVHLVSNNYAGSPDGSGWDELGLVWNNAPVISGTPLSNAPPGVVAGAFVELEVTAAIAGNGIYSFGLLSSSTNVATYSSKEGTNAPQLVIETTSAPIITSFTPASGPPGTEVTIVGFNFTGATGVAFNGAPAANFTVDSDTQIRAKVAAGPTTGKVRVTSADGSGTSATDFVLIEPASITSFVPASGPVGTEVTITGGNLGSVTGIALNGTAVANFTVVSSTQIRTKVPVGASTGKISLTNPTGTGFSANDFIVTVVPVITSFTPAKGPVGAEVTIAGNNFTGTSRVTFGDTAAAGFTVDSDTQLRARVPSGAETGKIGVTNSAGTDSSADDFTVIHPSAIASFMPVSGPAGTEVTIRGNHFTSITGVAFNGTAAAGFTVDSNTQIRVEVPAGATTGKIGITNPAGTSLSAADFTVTQNTLVFHPIEDAEVKSSNPGENYGSNAILRLRDGSVQYRSYVKFNVTGLEGSIKRATLRLFVSAGSDDGGLVYPVSNNYAGRETPWEEEDLTWNNAPIFGGAPLSSAAGPIVADTFVELEVTAAITGDGIYSFGLLSRSTNLVTYSSKEGANPPQLAIEKGSAPLGPSTFTFNPTDDAEVKSSFATTNYGANTVMRLREGSVRYHSYLKFNVTGLGGSVQSVRLRLYVDEGSDDGGAIYLVSNNYAGNPDGSGWDENGLVWDNAPPISGTPLSTVGGAVSPGTWVEFDVTAAIPTSRDGIYSFGLINGSTSAVKYGTKEGANPPELVIKTTSSSSLLRSTEANPEPAAPEREGITTLLPERLTLYPNHPNPFNAQTTIEYTLPLRASVQLVIYNVAGHLVRRLVGGTQAAGPHREVWDGKDEQGRVVTSGVYYYRLKVDNEIRVRQMTILR